MALHPARSRTAFVARLTLACASLGVGASASAIEVCELGGQPVNPNNGNTTEGKTGLMRCRDGEGGPVVREQELQKGRFMGAVRYFRDGALMREYSVNEKGNRDGVSREWAVPPGGGKPVLVREETMHNSKTVGIARTWYPTGKPQRLTFYGEQEREQAVAEFNAEGQLYDLRCAPMPVFGTDFDDRNACGFSGGPSLVMLYNGKGQLKGRVSFDRGERRKLETLWDNGSVHDVLLTSATGGSERHFADNGTLRGESEWTLVPGERPRRVTTLDREFHESGKRIRERHWTPSERGADLVSEETWYLNGQPKTRAEYGVVDGKPQRHELSFHDNGKRSFEGVWLLAARGSRDETATGTHQSFDSEGRLRSERHYDARGRLDHERELDESGRAVRDDEVFEDGSRKAVGR